MGKKGFFNKTWVGKWNSLFILLLHRSTVVNNKTPRGYLLLVAVKL